MRNFSVFLKTFLACLTIVFLSYAALLWWILPLDSPADTEKSDVPIISPSASDVLSTLVVLEMQERRFYFLIRADGINNAVSVTAIPGDYYFHHSQRTIEQSYGYAGIMQCVQDLEILLEQKNICHLLLTPETARQLSSSFVGISTANFADIVPHANSAELITPQQLLDIVGQNMAYFSTPEGLNRLNSTIAELIIANIVNIQNYTLPQISRDFSYLTTNIGTLQLDTLNRIFTFFSRSSPQTDQNVLQNQP